MVHQFPGNSRCQMEGKKERKGKEKKFYPLRKHGEIEIEREYSRIDASTAMNSRGR